MKPFVLVVDDEVSLCGLLEVFFSEKGYGVRIANTFGDAIKFLNEPEPLLALFDLALGNESGLDLVKDFHRRFPDLPIIVMTAYGTIEKAVEAIKLGAFDFLQKPFEMVFLNRVVEKASSTRNLTQENKELKNILRNQDQINLIGNSDVMRRLRATIDTIAISDSTVLVTGESGTGKEVIAKHIHRKSLRAQGPFVVVNCSALSENLLESELFGHVKGAFTSAVTDKMGLFALATKGTIFLDEIGEMPPRTQVKLLRMLQEREITPVGGTEPVKIDVRILAATNVNLEDAVQRGLFREDLYYRLNVIRISTPRLKDRGEDPVLLAFHFLEKKSKRPLSFSKEVLQKIRSYHWPGNVRQLENAVERAIAFCSGQLVEDIQLDDVRDSLEQDEHQESAAGINEGIFPDSTSLPKKDVPKMLEIEKAYIHYILSCNQWHKPTAARILGFDISTLYRKIEKYGLRN